MLHVQLADSLARQRHDDLSREAARHRVARSTRAVRQPPVWRVRVGWWLVTAGLRLALRSRAAPGAAAPVRPLARRAC